MTGTWIYVKLCLLNRLNYCNFDFISQFICKKSFFSVWHRVDLRMLLGILSQRIGHLRRWLSFDSLLDEKKTKNTKFPFYIKLTMVSSSRKWHDKMHLQFEKNVSILMFIKSHFIFMIFYIYDDWTFSLNRNKRIVIRHIDRKPKFTQISNAENFLSNFLRLNLIKRILYIWIKERKKIQF